ncbi:N-acetylmuramoyl-L-alanine amidase [Prosthecobacter fusiformis]|uniref:N-acetylmuramoyl-L-alanine amidase n=1 Tax=Prosthecobacter fusiformis TaxID=48464 RepID=A0A4R7S6H7_9BACT|nr:N-acetylmuramoyl-L-alanine amidase [Prosthecobacter fusiformis]TDU73286.1 N-acetylmuramoyl-L-alanine amidase [Prosthecobacter fusiformis]
MPLTRHLAAALLCLFLVACGSAPRLSQRSIYGDRPGPKGFNTVIIDAGHGGKDSGARARGLVEKQLALDVAKRLRSELWPGYKVVLMRDSDFFVDLDQRVARANRYGDAVLVSIHFNYGSRYRAGPETYYWRSDSYALAKRVQRNLSALAPYERDNAGLVRRRLRLTRNPALPCILVECGYLTNAKEAALVATSSYREKLAEAIARAIKDQARDGDAGMGPIPRPIYAPPSKAGDARG